MHLISLNNVFFGLHKQVLNISKVNPHISFSKTAWILYCRWYDKGRNQQTVFQSGCCISVSSTWLIVASHLQEIRNSYNNNDNICQNWTHSVFSLCEDSWYLILSKSTNWLLLSFLYLFYILGNRSMEKLRILSKTKQLIKSKAKLGLRLFLFKYFPPKFLT